MNDHAPAGAPPTAHEGYRADIDGLRAIAVLAVIAFHAQPKLVTGGFVGVDVFFVISGFLITGIILSRLQRGNFTITGFYARRVRRIFPALSLVLAAVLVAGWFTLLPSELADLGNNTGAGAGFVSNIVLWKQTNYFGPDVNSKPLLHLWSLGIEEQYYLVWPLLLMALWKFRTRLVPILVIFAASFVANIVLTSRDATAAFYSPASRAWELLLGSLIAYVAAVHGDVLTLAARSLSSGASAAATETRLREISAWLGLILLLVGVGVLTSKTAFPGVAVMAPTFGTALLICAGPRAWINRTLLSAKPVVLVGLISYPLYLFHWPVLAFLRIQFPDVSYALKIGALAGVFVAAYATYKLLELPIRVRGGTGAVGALCGAQALLLVAGLLLWNADGLPDRGNEMQRRIFALDQLHHGRGARATDTVAAGNIESGSCFLENTGPETFAKRCVDVADAAKPLILLWGDSFAGHLMPGLRGIAGDAMEVHMLTSAACAPIIGLADNRRPECARTNTFILDWVHQHKPEVVVVAARWNGYAQYARVDTTLKELRRAGVPRIVLVGSSAQFDTPVPRLLLRELAKGSIPQRLPSSFMPQLTRIDSTLRATAERDSVAFAAPLAVECTTGGCLLALDSATTQFTIWDTGHLTAIAARYVAERVLRSLIRP